MRIAYFDCFSGICGQMILGALIDAGVDRQELESELGRLKISGYKIGVERTTRGQISATRVSVDVTEPVPHRRLSDILGIIDRSDLEDEVKGLSKKIFRDLAAVEARIHNRDIEEIHFHEVGGLDCIIDVTGALIGLKKLGVEAVYSSRIPVGSGFVKCQHGVLPVPAPATVELLKGIPIYSNGIEAELTTPTGAAILKNISRGFGDIPVMRVERVGYGAGERELAIPNLLRVYIGETAAGGYQEEGVILVETNIDDMNPELVSYVFELLLEKGALDVFLTPIFMKKNRPGVILSVLTTPEKLDEILSILFTETTTLGVRIHRLEKKKLARETVVVKTKFGEIRVKIGRSGGQIQNVSPEYEDCKERAVKYGVPLKGVYEEAIRAAQKLLFDERTPVD